MAPMDRLDVLVSHLLRQDVAALTALLERRPDVVAGLPPGDLGELAERLWHFRSVNVAVQAVALPSVSVRRLRPSSKGTASTPSAASSGLSASRPNGRGRRRCGHCTPTSAIPW